MSPFGSGPSLCGSRKLSWKFFPLISKMRRGATTKKFLLKFLTESGRETQLDTKTFEPQCIDKPQPTSKIAASLDFKNEKICKNPLFKGYFLLSHKNFSILPVRGRRFMTPPCKHDCIAYSQIKPFCRLQTIASLHCMIQSLEIFDWAKIEKSAFRKKFHFQITSQERGLSRWFAY